MTYFELLYPILVLELMRRGLCAAMSWSDDDERVPLASRHLLRDVLRGEAT